MLGLSGTKRIVRYTERISKVKHTLVDHLKREECEYAPSLKPGQIHKRFQAKYLRKIIFELVVYYEVSYDNFKGTIISFHIENVIYL